MLVLAFWAWAVLDCGVALLSSSMEITGTNEACIDPEHFLELHVGCGAWNALDSVFGA